MMRWLMMVLVLIALPATAEIRDSHTHFFMAKMGDFKDELSVAKSEGKQGVLIMFEMDECPFCARMKGSILNQSLGLPRGLPALSVGQAVPLVTFSAEPDLATGGTVLTISPAIQFDNEQQAAQHLASTLSELIRREPAYWHHWYLCGL